MTDHLISYLKCVSLPSENIKSQRKKHFESLLKICKKNKRDFTSKLNKDQVDKSQVISYYENKRNQFNKIKKDRLEKIILLTQEFINDRSDDEIENLSDSTSDSKKRHIEEYDNGPSKKMKLISVDEEIIKTPINENKASNDNVNKENIEIHVDIDVYDDKLPSKINSNIVNTIEEIDEINHLETEKSPKPKEIEKKSSSSSENSTDKQADKTFDLKSINSEKQINIKVSEQIIPKSIIRSDNSSLKSQIPSKFPTKTGPTPARTAVKNNIDLKTPQQQQPIYKGKFTQSTNLLSNSLSKSQTLSTQKKPVAEIRKQQDKIEEEKKRKLEEKEAKRKENLMKLDMIKNCKKIPALGKLPINNNSSTTKPVVVVKPIGNIVAKSNNIDVPAVAKSTNPAKKPIVTSAQPQQIPSKTIPPKTGTVPLDNTKSINPIGQLGKLPNNSSSALKPINSDQKFLPKTESISEESRSISSAGDRFKTPFLKKRTTMLSDSCKRIIGNHESYYLGDLVDLDSDEDEEENRPSHQVPRWCHKDSGTLINLIKYQSKHYSASEIFLEACFVRIDYKQIFGQSVEIKPGCLEPWK